MSGAAIEGNDPDRFSKSKNLDHEVSEATLPKHLSNHIPGYSQDRSVMWTVPDQREGLRSKSPVSNSALASDVTGSGHAQHVPLPGAAVAGVESTQRTQSAAIVIEGSVDFDETVVRGLIANGTIDDEGWKPGDRMPAKSIERSFEIIQQARQALLQIDADRGRRKDTEPQPKTVANYQRKTALIDDLARSMEEVGGASSTCLALAQYADKTRSFYAMRSAFLWRSIGRMREWLQSQSSLQRIAPGSLKWTMEVDELKAEMHSWAQVTDLTLPAALALSRLVPRPSASKRWTLLRVNEDWRERFMKACVKSTKYRLANVALACTGLRPIELEGGIAVRRRGPVVAMKINGAKVRSTAGQPWRTLFIPVEQLPGWFLEAIGSAPTTIAAPADAMRSYLARLSKEVFDPKKDGTLPILSAYSFRHSLVTDMRIAGWSSDEIAGVLGEKTARTSRWYGLRKRGSKSPRSAISVVRGSVLTARPVMPADKSWIVQRASKRAKPKGSGSR